MPHCDFTLEYLTEQKLILEKELTSVNSRIKDFKYKEMLLFEKHNSLTIGCKIEIDSKDNIPSNSASCLFVEFLGIEDLYPFGLHQIKIGYRLQGCSYHTFFYHDITKIKKISNLNKGLFDE